MPHRRSTRRSLLAGASALLAWASLAARARAGRSSRGTGQRRPVAPGDPAPPNAAVGAWLAAEDTEPPFRISLAQWSLHRTHFAGELDTLDFPAVAAEEYGLEAVEYVNVFFRDHATDFAWLDELNTRTSDAGVRSLLIMVDGEGELAQADEAGRRQAIENHYKWVVAARVLGCHSIRVNAAGAGERHEVAARAADSLHHLATWAADYDISVIVENHGGLSSDGSWLADVMVRADHPGVGTLPDFGNFHLGDDAWYDRYQGVAELMPFAKAVSAKSHEFDEAGDEVRTDYRRMLDIVLAAGYRGWIGIEYEGSVHPEREGIRLTLELLQRIRTELAASEGR